MAVRFSFGNYLHTSQAAFSIDNMTFGGWFKRKVATGSYASCVYISNNGDAEYFLETNSGGDVFEYFDLVSGDETELVGGAFTIDEWFFLLVSRTNSGCTLYYGTEAGGTLTAVSDVQTHDPGLFSNVLWYIGNDVYTEPLNGEGAYVGFWDIAFDALEADAQWRSTTPTNGADLIGWYALADAATAGEDTSGNNFDMTIVGTLADGGANPVPPSGGGGLSIPVAMYNRRMQGMS